MPTALMVVLTETVSGAVYNVDAEVGAEPLRV